MVLPEQSRFQYVPMYYAMLAPGNTDFDDGVTRSLPRFRTKRLDAVVAAVATAQKVRSAATLAALITALQQWRMSDPKEFANRGGTNGVAYRLWMEAKQLLLNKYQQNVLYPDPPIPGNCPGSTLLGIYVPPGEGHTEICHGFAYRWFIAAGRIAENPALPALSPSFNATNVPPVLYPAGGAGYPAARAGGLMALQPGDLVAMFVPAPNPAAPLVLGHSLIAETATTWFSANNAGTFGVGTGRSRIDTTQNFGVFAGLQSGWVGGTNVWRRPDGIQVSVVYRR